MKNIKGLCKNLKIGSLYVRWIFLFMMLLMLSHFVSVLYIANSALPKVKGIFTDEMQKKAEMIQLLADKDFEVTDELIEKAVPINMAFVTTNGSNLRNFEAYENEISIGMINRATEGEILTFNSKGSIPMCLFKAGEQYILFIPKPIEGGMDIFKNSMHGILQVGTFIAAFLIVIALIVIIRPLKKVIKATDEVSKGNFDIYIPQNHKGDIGLLISNFNKMTKSLKKNEYLRKDFVSSVSHEFKTPITSIEGFARLLQNEDITPEEIKEYTNIIINESSRLLNVSVNLLKLSELDSRAVVPIREKFYLDEQIRGIILLMESQWSKKNITFDFDIRETIIYENEELLHHVWLNIIQNAIKFSYYNSVISVAIIEEEKTVKVSIKDYGPGMTHEQTEKIFDRFYQADSSRSGDGSGLGLSIVKRIIDILNGEIICESQLGKGTTFTVTLNKG
ncbi:MAG TPA: sensor histidine kinase [Clostridiales bacterium]|nr:sensor histidine kinase [Clostridiales bacterium]